MRLSHHLGLFARFARGGVLSLGLPAHSNVRGFRCVFLDDHPLFCRDVLLAAQRLGLFSCDCTLCAPPLASESAAHPLVAAQSPARRWGTALSAATAVTRLRGGVGLSPAASAGW